MILRRLALISFAFAVLPSGALAAAPLATTEPAKDVQQTTATLVAKVTAGGAATNVKFELGTTTSYGLASASKDVAADATDTTVEIAVASLSADTTYHYRVVATNADGTTNGADATFKTLAPSPARPGAITGGVQDVTATSARLTGQATLRGQPTTAYFEYGSGLRTPDVDLGGGTGSVGVSAEITGLSAGTSYTYRLVVRAAAGTSRGSRQRFRTPSAVSAASLALTPAAVLYGGALRAVGRLNGAQVDGTRVAVEIKAFPFSGAWRQVGPDKAVGANGRYEFMIVPILTQTLVRVVTRSGPRIIQSSVLAARSTMRVGLLAPRRRGSRVVARGGVRPALPSAVASLQRRSPTGAWVTVQRQQVKVSGGRATYRFDVRRPRRGADIRVLVRPNDNGGHIRGLSRPRFVHGLR